MVHGFNKQQNKLNLIYRDLHLGYKSESPDENGCAYVSNIEYKRDGIKFSFSLTEFYEGNKYTNAEFVCHAFINNKIIRADITGEDYKVIPEEGFPIDEFNLLEYGKDEVCYPD